MWSVQQLQRNGDERVSERCFELISLDLDTTKKFRLPLCESSNDILFTITLKIYLEVRFIKIFGISLLGHFGFYELRVNRKQSY